MTLKIKDAEGQVRHVKASGTGTPEDPLSTEQRTQVVNFPPIWAATIENFPATQAIFGSVSILNFPATQNIAGVVSVSNLPSGLAVVGDRLKVDTPAIRALSSSGDSVAVVQSGTWSIGISNFPATQTVAGSVSVSNFPSGFQVSNFPATQTVAGSVGVSNFPTSFQVSNFPATQTIAGTVNLGTTGNLATASDIQEVRVSLGNTPIDGTTMPTGGMGLFGWLSAIWKVLSDRLPTLVSGKIPTDSLLEGTDITGTAIPAGGTSGRGWLSAIWKLFSERIPILGANSASYSTPVTLASDGIFAFFAGLASDTASITGSIHAKLRALAQIAEGIADSLGLETTLQSILSAIPSPTKPVLVRNISNKFREDFAGSSLDPLIWQIIQTGAGQTITVTTSELRIVGGTTINAETVIKSLTGFTIPMRVIFTFYISQRIANQEIYFEVTDSTGNNVARLLFNSTTNTNTTIQTANNGTNLALTNFTINATSSYAIVEADINIDEVDFYPRTVDSANARGVGVTKTRFLPDPNQLYYLQIRFKNLTSAPASNTTLFIDSITVQDVEEFSVEINGGRGGANSSQAIPVVASSTLPVSIAATIPVSIAATSNFNLSSITASVILPTVKTAGTQVIESVSNLTASATYSGASRNTSLLRNNIRGWIFTDQPGTLTIEQSTDSATWRFVYSLSILANTVATLYSMPIYAQYYRCKFTNTGASTQTAMHLISNTFD